MSHEPPLPSQEEARLRALEDLLVLDTAPEPVFDSLTKAAAAICGTPVALVSLVDARRQWFKASLGLDGETETPRQIAFCAHAILQDEVLEVPDATADVRFADNPLVTGDAGIRFYAGAPLVVAGGARVGTLCVIDREPRRLTEAQASMLRHLAAVASDTLAMRRDLTTKLLSARSAYEKTLEISELHYRQIVEDQRELISLATPEGELTYVNPAYASYFGSTPNEMVGKSLFDFIDATDRGAVRALLARILATGIGSRGENRMTRPDGSLCWIAWSNGIQRDSQGRITIHSVGRDVTERKKSEELLRASQSFLYRTGRAAGVGGWELELATGTVTWSEETRRIHEVSDAYRPTLESAIEFYSAEARATVTAAVQAGLDRGEPWEFEHQLVTAKGRVIWVRAVGEVEYDQGKPIRLIGAFQDITARKALEQKIASQSATLALITEAIPATVAVVNADGRYRFVNGAFARGSGRRREDIVGATVREVLGEVEFARRWPWVQRALAGDSVDFELEYVGPTFTSLSYVPLRLIDQTIEGFVVVTQDVTQQKRESMRLIELTQRDPLTTLLNRAGFENFMERTTLEGGGPNLSVLYIDLDGFKPVNDRHGHAAGDRILIQFGERMRKLVRPSDALARLGGDEFAVALVGIRDPAHSLAIAEKIVDAARLPFDIDGVRIVVGASVGMAHATDQVSKWCELVERADGKLLAAKAQGKGRHVAERWGS